MIKTPTTFVVGAGGSFPYGLPIGNKLLNLAKLLEPRLPAYQLLLQAGVSNAHLAAFLEDLKNHANPAPTIDSFLEHRQQNQHHMRVGRFVIAVLMGQAMYGRAGENSDRDWLGYLIEEMRSGCPEWHDFSAAHQQLRFVTFNFDTIIEDRLRGAIRALYPAAATGHVDQLIEQSVIHVHGQIPWPPTVQLQECLEGVPPAWVEWVKEAAASLHVVQDEIDAAVVEQARTALRQADIVCFLGFHYARENLFSRLDISNTVVSRQSSVSLFGSAYGLDENRQSWVKDRFGTRIRLSAEDCLSSLKSFPVFRD